MAFFIASSCHPNCIRAMNAQEEHDASQSAALIAVHLISSARLILKLDSEYTDFSAQYLVERACPKNEEGKDQDLTVKAALEFILREGIPKLTQWTHLGCTFKSSPLVSNFPRTFMRGEVIEATTLKEAYELLAQQPVGARLHVFSPEFDNMFSPESDGVGDGIYVGPSSNATSYVGLRDVVILSVDIIGEDSVATVTLCYKKKPGYVKVSLTTMFLSGQLGGDDSKIIGPSSLIVDDYCVPRLSK